MLVFKGLDRFIFEKTTDCSCSNSLCNITFITFFHSDFINLIYVIILFFIFQFYKVDLYKFHYFYILIFKLFSKLIE